MKVAVLGATGSTGALVVDKLLAEGHDVVVVSRSPAPARHQASRLSLQTGDLTDGAFLQNAIADCDAVISCIGQNRASKSLFAKRTSPPDIFRRHAAVRGGAGWHSRRYCMRGAGPSHQAQRLLDL